MGRSVCRRNRVCKVCEASAGRLVKEVGRLGSWTRCVGREWLEGEVREVKGWGGAIWETWGVEQDLCKTL